MTFLELAEKVLKEEKRPLAASEIWALAKEKGYDKEINSKGKTPWATLYAQIYVNTRDIRKSLFAKTDSRPKKFYLKSQVNKFVSSKMVVDKKLTIIGQIRKIAFEILEKIPEGIKYCDLKRKILEQNKSFKSNTIESAIWNLDVIYPDKVCKPHRGLFRLLKYSEDMKIQPNQQSPVITKKKKIKEEDFYNPFANWLVKELEECTKAIGLGYNYFKDKWGTPDVVGIRESKKSDIIQFPTEIISAEIKIDSTGLIEAFGQACAYKIFSHKSYIVVPNDSQTDDINRLDTLCRQFGIGLILFDNKSLKNPKFEIRVRAIKHEPDMFFVNKNLKLIEDKLFK